jgi:hypothetical protein
MVFSPFQWAVVVIVLVDLACRSVAFSFGPSSTNTNVKSFSEPMPTSLAVSRKSFFQGIVSQGAAAVAIASSTSSLVLVAYPESARADVTSKVASSTALRNVKRAQKQLTKLLPYVEFGEYAPIVECFRTSPFAEIRKNCATLIKGAEDGPLADLLLDKYKAFVASVEKLNYSSSQGVRGRTIPSEQLVKEYRIVESTLADFIAVAEESVEIPLMQPEVAESAL